MTGGVYKIWERIHRNVADLRLLAIPASWRRVSATNPNWDKVFEIGKIITNELPIVLTIVARV